MAALVAAIAPERDAKLQRLRTILVEHFSKKVLLRTYAVATTIWLSPAAAKYLVFSLVYAFGHRRAQKAYTIKMNSSALPQAITVSKKRLRKFCSLIGGAICHQTKNLGWRRSGKLQSPFVI
jgi:hypothetical protein